MTVKAVGVEKIRASVLGIGPAGEVAAIETIGITRKIHPAYQWFASSGSKLNRQGRQERQAESFSINLLALLASLAVLFSPTPRVASSRRSSSALQVARAASARARRQAA